MLNNEYLKALKQLVDLVWRQMWREYDPKLSSLAIMIEPLPISAIDEPREFQRRRSHGRSHPDHCRSHTSTLQLSTWDCCQTHWPPVVPVVTPWHWPHWNGLQYQCQSLNNFHAFQVFWFSSDSIALLFTKHEHCAPLDYNNVATLSRQLVICHILCFIELISQIFFYKILRFCFGISVFWAFMEADERWTREAEDQAPAERI